MRIELAEEFDRPVDEVFRFYAEGHVKNHPRWDPDIELGLDKDAPIGVGTVIRRRNRRSGTPVEGTMDIVQYEPNRSFGVLTRDGPMEIRGRLFTITKPLEEVLWAADHSWLNDIAYRMKSDLAQAMELSRRPSGSSRCTLDPLLSVVLTFSMG